MKIRLTLKYFVLLVWVVTAGVSIAQEPPQKVRLSSAINSPYEEVKPIFSNGNMYFVRSLHPANKAIQSIWKSTYKEGAWQEAVLVDSALNFSDRFNAICKISEDGNSFYLTNISSDRRHWSAGITRAIRSKRGWVYRPFYVVPFKNKGYIDFWISEDNRLLFFSASKTKSGKEDIYMVTRGLQDWNEPVLLKSINSKFSESAPFYDVQNRILYITSNRNGNYDIFGAQAVDSSLTSWSTLTYSDFNTELFEGYYYSDPDGGTYLVSQESVRDALDIYQYGSAEIKIKEEYIELIEPAEAILLVVSTDKKTGLPLDSKLKMTMDGIEYTENSKAGKGSFNSPINQEVNLTVSFAGYYPVIKSIKMGEGTVKEKVELTPVEVGETIVLHNIFFDSDQSLLKTESYPEMDVLSEFMKANKGIKIKITGHTDNQGDDNYNLKLSQERIESVVKYLIQKGVSGDRVKGEGMGEKNPVTTNQTPEGRAQNRRVEFTILEK